MSQHKVLVVLSSHNKLGTTGKPTGWFLVRPIYLPSSPFPSQHPKGKADNPIQPEFAHPYKELAPHAQITVASPAGGEAPLDPSSIDKSDQVSMDFLKNQEPLFKNTEKLEKFVGHAKDFDAIFYVGGHGRTSRNIPLTSPPL